MPEPIIAPIPRQVRSNAVNDRFIWRSGCADSRIKSSGLFVLKSCEATFLLRLRLRERIVALPREEGQSSSFPLLRARSGTEMTLTPALSLRERENLSIIDSPWRRFLLPKGEGQDEGHAEGGLHLDGAVRNARRVGQFGTGLLPQPRDRRDETSLHNNGTRACRLQCSPNRVACRLHDQLLNPAYGSPMASCETGSRRAEKRPG